MYATLLDALQRGLERCADDDGCRGTCTICGQPRSECIAGERVDVDLRTGEARRVIVLCGID